ncbi:MAG: 50S ribosomal protein L29 [Verrucomicrobiales bacterium]|nr:50S ribosomal protein L29 [Verrucomicrobiales bacterium]
MASNIKELRELSNEEMATRRRDLKEEMLNLRVQQEAGQLENPARIRTARREIARIETILSERKLQAAAEAVNEAPAEPEEEPATVAAE